MSVSLSGAGNEKPSILKFVSGCNPVDSKQRQDGKVEITCEDRRTISQSPNGPIEIYNPIEDQTEYRDPETGKLLRIETNEWTAFPEPDGRMKYMYRSGEIKYVDETNGVITRISADGKETTVVDAKKCAIRSERVNPDGTKTVKYADRNTSYIVIGGLVPTTYSRNGSVSFGNSAPVPIDRTQAAQDNRTTRIPYGDGNYFIERKSGDRYIELYQNGNLAARESFLSPEYCSQ